MKQYIPFFIVPHDKITTPHIQMNSSIIRTPKYTLLVLENGNIRALRDGAHVWSKNKVRQDMPTWPNLDQFLREASPLWWTIDCAFPVGWFNDMNIKFENLANTMPTDFQKLDTTWRESIDAEKKRFYDEIITPLVKRYNLVRAMDYNNNENVFGTLDSPAARMAEEQMLELEPDRTKWTTRAYSQRDSYFRRLYNRNRSYTYRKMREEKVKAAAAPLPLPIAQASPAIREEEYKLRVSPSGRTISFGPPPTSLMPQSAAPSASLMPQIAPSSSKKSVIITREKIDILLAAGVKKVSDELWALLKGL